MKKGTMVVTSIDKDDKDSPYQSTNLLSDKVKKRLEKEPKRKRRNKKKWEKSA